MVIKAVVVRERMGMAMKVVDRGGRWLIGER